MHDFIFFSNRKRKDAENKIGIDRAEGEGCFLSEGQEDGHDEWNKSEFGGKKHDETRYFC